MHLEHNLALDKPIVDQLDTLAVAVNCFNPKAEDYVYKFSECTAWQKDILKGMAIAIDCINTLCANRVEECFGYEPEAIREIRLVYEQNILVEAGRQILYQMLEALVSFEDNNSEED